MKQDRSTRHWLWGPHCPFPQTLLHAAARTAGRHTQTHSGSRITCICCSLLPVLQWHSQCLSCQCQCSPLYTPSCCSQTCWHQCCLINLPHHVQRCLSPLLLTLSAKYAIAPCVAGPLVICSVSADTPLLVPLIAALTVLMMGGTICCSGLGTMVGPGPPAAKWRSWLAAEHLQLNTAVLSALYTDWACATFGQHGLVRVHSGVLDEHHMHCSSRPATSYCDACAGVAAASRKQPESAPAGLLLNWRCSCKHDHLHCNLSPRQGTALLQLDIA